MKRELDWAKIKQRKEFQIDPAILYRPLLSDLLVEYRIKLISFQNEPEIIMNMLVLAKKYFSKEVFDELYLYLDNDTIRHLKIMQIIEE